MDNQDANTLTTRLHQKRRPAPSVPLSRVRLTAACNSIDAAGSQPVGIAVREVVESKHSSVDIEHQFGGSNVQLADSKSSTINCNHFGNGNTINNREFDAKKVPVDVNLHVKCNHLIDLLHRLHLHMDPVINLPEGAIKEAILQRSIFRYETLWLPLSAEYRLYAGAPVDVQWLWLAHMLDPAAYRLDCQRITGTFVNHRLVTQKRFYQLTQRARKLWNLRYPKQPFAFIANDSATESIEERFRDNRSDWSHKISRKLLRSVAEKHHEFLYQVSLPHFRHAELLQEASLRYQKYLFLRKVLHYRCNCLATTNSIENDTRSAAFGAPFHLLPTDIDLCWRAHLYQPSVYSHNTGCLFGKLLPYYSDHQRDSRQDLDWIHQLDLLWRQEFPSHPLYKSGFCRRFASGKSVFQTLDNVELYNMSTKCATVVIKSITPKLPHSVDKFAITIRRTAIRIPNDPGVDLSTDSVVRLTSADFRRHQKQETGEVIRRQSTGMRMISGVCGVIALELIDKRGWICPSNAVLGYGQLDLTETLETFMGTETVEREFIIPIKEEFTTNGFQSTSPCDKSIASAVSADKIIPDQPKRHPISLKTSYFQLSLAIDPPSRHAVHLQVKLGVELVCQLPPPNSNYSGVWGPVTACLSLSSNKYVLSEISKGMNSQNPPSFHSDNNNDRHTNSRLFQNGHGFPSLQLDTGCSLVLIHQILNHNRQQVLTVRVLHNICLGLSVVQVYSGQKLVAIGHQLHSEHLPELRTTKRCKQRVTKLNRTFKYIKTHCFNKSRSQSAMESPPPQDFPLRDATDQPESNMDSMKERLKPNDPATWCLQPERSERAMLVKDDKGDWCLLVGAWSGFKRQPSQANTDAETVSAGNNSHYCVTRGNCGQLTLRARWLGGAQGDISFAQIPDTLNNQSIMLKDMSVDMKTGKIIIGRTCNDVAQYVCLAFCCSILHVLCQPRIITPEVSGESLSPGVEMTEFTMEQRQPMEDGTVKSGGAVQQLSKYHSFRAAPETPTGIDLSTMSTASKRMSRLSQPRAVIKKYSWLLNPVNRSSLSNLSDNLFDGNDADLIKVIGGATIHCSNMYVRQVYSSLIEDQTVGLPTCLSNFRNPMASLSHVMCRASGLPFDALIPSVQYLRFIERCSSDGRWGTLQSSNEALDNHKYKLVHRNSSQNLISTRTRVSPNRLSHSSHKDNLAGVKESCGKCSTLSIDNNHDHNTRGDHSSTLTNAAIRDEEGMKLNSSFSQNGNINLPHVGFRLVDFYDLFLLQLPDICSGCVDGCRYCNGPTMW